MLPYTCDGMKDAVVTASTKTGIVMAVKLRVLHAYLKQLMHYVQLGSLSLKQNMNVNESFVSSSLYSMDRSIKTGENHSIRRGTH